MVSGILVKTYKPINGRHEKSYVNGYHIEREAVLHPEGTEIELPPEKEEELPSVSEGVENVDFILTCLIWSDEGTKTLVSRGNLDMSGETLVA
jgi:hypothetical protein